MRLRLIERLAPFLIGAMLLSHTALLAWSAYRHSPVVAEVGHLPAGISHWQFGRFDLYRVNPPLVRMVAALPMMLANPDTDWSNYSLDPLTRSETTVGIDFVNANGYRTFWLYTIGRWACIPFSLMGAAVCFVWARDLYGLRSGLAAMALWCFCPNILGNGSLIMPDVPAAALGAVACYTFWCWMRKPTWLGAIGAGAVLGAAELTKTTLIVLFPLWPLLWLIYRLPDRRRLARRDWLREGEMVLLRMLVAVYVINLGYGFEGSWQQLGEYRFKSHALTGAPAGDRRFEAGNRFADTRLGSLPVPFPKNYVQGIDTQKVDFEHGMRSYLRGQWSERGWWYFYLYALAVKVPLGTWALVVLAMAITVFPGRRAVRWRDEILVLLPLAVILILVSSQTGFSIHFRYVVPIFPFLFIWASKAFCMSRARAGVLADGEVQANRTDDPSPPRETGHGDWIGLGEGIGQPSSDERGQDPCPPQGQGRVRVGRARGFLATAALAWAITGSLWYYPHSLSYFNELVGGPEHGHEHLLDSSIACGQNLLYLKEWYDAHPDARPLRLAAFGTIDPLLAGIEFTVPATSVAKPRSADQANEGRTDIQPGWYAIDVNYLHGSGRPAAGGGGARRPTKVTRT